MKSSTIEQYIHLLKPSEKSYLERIQNKTALWTPQSKVQWQAILCQADELYFGGSAGGGKTFLLIGMAIELHQHSAIFRRTYPNLTEIIRETRNILEGYARENRMEHTWTYPDGRTIEFGAVQYEDDKKKWQGRAHDLKSFDEITEFTESQYEFISGWNRTADECQRARVIVTGNPPIDEGGSWVKRRWGAWVDDKHHRPATNGELRWYVTVDGKEQECDGGGMFIHKGEKIYPRSRTFIRAMLADNIFYSRDNRYLSVLQSLPEELRGPLLNGDFNAAAPPEPFQIIPTEWVRAAQRRWLEREKPTTPLTAVGVDPSRGGADKTAVGKRYDNWFEVYSWPGVVAVDGPTVAALVQQAVSGEVPPSINLDANGIGSSVYDSLISLYAPGIIHAFNAAEASEYRDKSRRLKMRNKRAEMYWRMRDALDPESGEDLALPPDTELLADLCSARYKNTASGVLVEEKGKIKERIGRSPDVGEAVMYAYMSGLTKPQLF
jgi:hypothetical protein